MHPSATTQEDQVLDALNHAGDHGASSLDLNKIALRYSAIIHTLRHIHGFNIVTKKGMGSQKQFILIPDQHLQAA